MARYTKVEVTSDDVIGEATTTLMDIIHEARKKAIQEGIMANTVLIDKHWAKVNAFDTIFGCDLFSLPPMICGLELRVSDELPEGYSLAVVEAKETERERIVRQAKTEVAREIFEEIENIFGKHMLWYHFTQNQYEKYELLKKKRTEDCDE